MAKTKSMFSSAMLAALGIASGSAHAVPIVVEFAGTAGTTSTADWLNGAGSSEDTLLDQAVIGRITIETAGLSQTTTSTPGFSNLLYYNAASDPLRLATSELEIAGVDYSMGAYPYQSGGIISQDALFPEGNDSIFIQHSSSQRPPGSPTANGQYSAQTLSLRWHDPNDPHGLVDLSLGLDPLSLVSTLNSLPILAQYTTGIISCVDGVCATTTQSSTSLLISSFQVHIASVPEPGTLALFAMGLLGANLARRRPQR